MIVMIDTIDGRHFQTLVVGSSPVTLTRLLENITAYGTVKVMSSEHGELQIPLEEIKRIGFSVDPSDGVAQ